MCFFKKPILTFEEFSNMVDSGEKLIIIDNKIYNVSNINHPPGNNILEKAIKSKKDQKENINFHSNKTKKFIKKNLFIGKLKK